LILKVENIAKAYGKKKVLTNVSFEIQKGKMCGIVGENGSGKSTLMKIIVGELKANKGKISYMGRLGYCPQDALLFPQLTIYEHFIYFSKAYKINRTDLHERCNVLLRQFNFKKYGNEKVANLSGGTKQKLNLSIALIHQPDLLILDEPYNGFDWETYMRFWEFTGQLVKSDCSILIVTHFIDKKDSFDAIYELSKGQLK